MTAQPSVRPCRLRRAKRTSTHASPQAARAKYNQPRHIEAQVGYRARFAGRAAVAV